MRSSTSSFKAVLAVCVLGLLAGAGWLGRAFLAPSARVKFVHTRHYDFLERLKTERPDVVIVGNSMVGMNLDEALLSRLLSKGAGRPVKAMLLDENGTASAWWYLVLKNFVRASGLRGIAVGVVTAETTITEIYGDLNPHELWLLAKVVSDDDDAFFEKAGRGQKDVLDKLHSRPDRRLVGREVLKSWLNATLAWRPAHEDARVILERRLGLADPHPFQLLQKTVGEVETKPELCLEPARCADKTFLPDMIETMKGFDLFIVESRRRPGTPDTRTTPAYRKALAAYLAERGVTYISLRDHAELGDPKLWMDPNHVNEAGRAVNTAVFAQEILRAGLLTRGTASQTGSKRRF